MNISPKAVKRSAISFFSVIFQQVTSFNRPELTFHFSFLFFFESEFQFRMLISKQVKHLNFNIDFSCLTNVIRNRLVKWREVERRRIQRKIITKIIKKVPNFFMLKFICVVCRWRISAFTFELIHSFENFFEYSCASFF